VTDAKGQFKVKFPVQAACTGWMPTPRTTRPVPQAKERRLAYVATLEVMP
jgi:hypothetical protein